MSPSLQSSANSPTSQARDSFFDLTRNELSRILDRDFRSTQIFKAVYDRWADDFDQITNLPKQLRSKLKNRLDLSLPIVHRSFTSSDGTLRYLLRLKDHEMTEVVFIPDGKRRTICISSQVGCALACSFCLTGQLGFTRHLKAGEIVQQVLLAQRLNIDPVERNHFNVVLMGMGEPLHNYNNVMKALKILHDPAGLGMSMSRITISTAGLVPELKRLSNEALLPNLAVSITGTSNEQRDALMPINRTYPIESLISVLRKFPLKPNQRITFEYVLIKGVTDSLDNAHRLAKTLASVRSKINLIPLNEAPDLSLTRSPDYSVREFQAILQGAGIPTFVRKSRGSDISAACGQLKKRFLDGEAEIDMKALQL